MQPVLYEVRPVPAQPELLLPAADRVDAQARRQGGHVVPPAAIADGGAVGSPALRVVVPVRTISSSNAREHWAVRARRVKAERGAAFAAAFAAGGGRAAIGPGPGTVVRLTRITGPRGKTLDDDNLRGCLKAMRDGVADWLGVQDNDPRITWRYDQRKADAWGVEIEVTA